VVEALRREILSGAYAPGQRLVEVDLCTRFGSTRGAVRTALVELDHEGLVRRSQHRGAVVRVVTLDEALEVTEVRGAVESLCAAKAAERITDEQIEILRALGRDMHRAVTEGDHRGYSALSQTLHTHIQEIAGQNAAAETLTRLRAQVVRHQFRLARPGRVRASLSEHLAIIDEISARAPESAARAMRRHLSSVMDALRATATDPEADSTPGGGMNPSGKA